MSDKSPRKSMSKKSGKSLKEKRAEKKAKHDRKATAPGVHPHQAPLSLEQHRDPLNEPWPKRGATRGVG